MAGMGRESHSKTQALAILWLLLPQLGVHWMLCPQEADEEEEVWEELYLASRPWLGSPANISITLPRG